MTPAVPERAAPLLIAAVLAVALVAEGCAGAGPVGAPIDVSLDAAPEPSAPPSTSTAAEAAAAEPRAGADVPRGDPESVAALRRDVVDDQVAPVVVIARRGAVRLSPTGPVLGDAARGGSPAAWPWGPAEEVRVSSPGARPVRVKTDTGEVRLLLYVDDRDLGSGMNTREALRPSPGAATPARGRVELAEGASVERLAASDDGAWVRVRREGAFGASGDRVEGWVPSASVGSEVVRRFFEYAPANERHTAEVRPGAPLLERPGGAALTTFPATGPDAPDVWTAVPLGAPQAGHQLVAYVDLCFPRVRLVGWVQTVDVAVVDARFGMRGCGTGTGGPPTWGALDGAPRADVEAGRWLLHPSTREVVGLVVAPATLARRPGGTLHVATKFGPIPVVLAPERWSP